MQKFNKILRGYDPVEVNDFLDKVISKVEAIIAESKEKDALIEKLKIIEIEYNSLKQGDLERLKNIEYEYNVLKQKSSNNERLEETLKRAILMAEKTSEQIKITAHKEREILIAEAKQHANRIVNDALLKSDNIDKEANTLKRNVMVLKRRLKEILETQLEFVEEIEKLEIE